MARNLFWLVVLTLIPVWSSVRAAETFAYRSGSGDSATTFDIGPGGIERISVGERSVAQGMLRLVDASWLTKTKGNGPAPDGFQKSVERLGKRRFRVLHESQDVSVSYLYCFDGEDVLVQARVSNRAEIPLPAVDFTGLEFEFGDERTGYFMDFGRATLAGLARRGRGYHPSFENLIGGSCVANDAFGVGLSPQDAKLERTIFWWEKGRRLHYIVPKSVPAGGARTYAFRMRASKKTDWQHLLGPYRDYFRDAYGGVKYRVDRRPVAQYVAADSAHGGPGTDNPLGWFFYRLSEEEGMRRFARSASSLLDEANGQGIIVWALTGWNRRGVNYRPDFDVLPPGVVENLSLWRNIFGQSELRLGSLARPGQIVTPVSWEKDGTVELHSDSSSQMKVQTRRFRRMMDRGFTLFYLDSFGTGLDDAITVKEFRKAMGSDVLVYCEYWTDVLMVYGGGYMEIMLNENRDGYRDFWHRLRAWEIIRWLLPGAQAVAHTRRIRNVPDGLSSPEEFLYQSGITPMFQIVGQDAKKAARLGELSRKYIEEARSGEEQ